VFDLLFLEVQRFFFRPPILFDCGASFPLVCRADDAPLRQRPHPVMMHDIPTELPSVVLRLLKEEDAAELSLLVKQHREYLREWLCWADQPNNPADQLKFINTSSERAVAEMEFQYAILAGREIAGIVSFNNIQKRNRCATLGHWLAKPHTGRGIMTAAVKALIAFKAKTVTLALSAQQAQLFQQAVGQHRKLEALLEKMRAISQKILLGSVPGPPRRKRAKPS
jgi:RimJ/RimL family protein N-acetyltransferase